VKHLLVTLLKRIGLTPSGHYREALAREQRAAVKLRQLQDAIRSLKADRTEMKARVQAELHRAKALDRQLTVKDREMHRKIKGFNTYKEKAERRAKDLRRSFQEAEQLVAQAREQLATVEVKLDILEGAANVLDLRTRSSIANDAGEPGAVV
jgi:chromosome segregation ATPase